MPLSRIFVIAILFLTMISPLSFSATVSTEEMTFLAMYFKEEELQIISATRSLKSISRIAENVTVITAEEIESMSAHTVADVLYWTNGVQVNKQGGPGSVSVAYIQGSEFRHVSVFLDGTLLNFLSDNVTDLGLIPVQMIEKIEVIKGPASSAWGSSLGGVVNIITKSSGNRQKPGGTFSVSYGEEDTGDFRGELYGKLNDFGYYLYAGRLQSDSLNGLPPNSDFSGRNFYTKLSYALSKNIDLAFTLLYLKTSRGKGEFPEFDFADKDADEQYVSTLSLNTVLTDDLTATFSLRSNLHRKNASTRILSTGDLFDANSKDKTYGGSVKFAYSHGIHAVVFGSDYDDSTFDFKGLTRSRETAEKWAVFMNDTITLGKLSITPGIRYDDQDPFGDFVSPSLGITYALFDNTLLRAYVARGFSNSGLAPFTSDELAGYKGNPDLDVEEVWSYQLGVETGALKYLWLKVSAFRHDIENVIVQELIEDPIFVFTEVNQGKQRRQGFEVDFRTVPFYYFTLFGGATFVDAEDLETDETIRGVPRYTYDIGLKYDDEKSFKAQLLGHYIWWNSPSGSGGKYDDMIFDITLIKSIFRQQERALEIFLSGHNIFNGKQYPDYFSQTPRRWIEGGIRVKF